MVVRLSVSAELGSLLVLGALPGVGPRTVGALTRRFGSARAALAVPVARFGEVAGRGAAVARDDSAVRARVEAALALAAARGMSVIDWNDPAYPERLRHLADPPPVLFLRGRVELLGGGGVAVVGARRATGRGRAVAHRLAGALAGAGTSVVSGLALGVDGAAHAGALEAGGPTVAVLGCGADRPYPVRHARLFRAIGRQGLLVSEFLPGTGAAPYHFPRRNRLIAALVERVVVVEAGARSGALITVDHALDLGVEVWAVPGPIDVPTTAGSNALLADGALPLTSIERFAGAEGSGGAGATAEEPEALLDGDARRMLRCLGRQPRSIDEVAREAGLPTGRALALLTALELAGRAERAAGARFRRAG